MLDANHPRFSIFFSNVVVELWKVDNEVNRTCDLETRMIAGDVLVASAASFCHVV